MTSEKKELALDLLGKADSVVADSISQCIDHGECHAAIRDDQINESTLVEQGDVIKHPEKGLTHTDQITVADLTGVAVQDIQATRLVVMAHRHHNEMGNNT